MAGRPQAFDEKAVMEKATELFWTRGYEATSLDDLLQAMGLGKSSFYNAFGSKRDLFSKVMESYVNETINHLRRELETGTHPIATIKDFFRGMANASTGVQQKGCFMGNTVVELSHTDKQLKARAARKLESLGQLFEHYIRVAQASGELKNNADPAILAVYLLNMWNGLNITRRVHGESGILAPLIELQLQVLT